METGKQLLTTRGALTTFSIANDLAKYFAILSAVIFNALIIVGLIPLALRGVRYKPSTAKALLRNLLVYGLGGIVTPFAGIWLIDLLVRNEGCLIGGDRLLETIWGPEYLDRKNYLRVYIAQLRRKLEPDPPHPRHLLTEPGSGYHFVR